jgi:hypothetical protein
MRRETAAAGEPQTLRDRKAINIMRSPTLRIVRALIVALMAAPSTVVVVGRPQASAPAPTQVAVTGDVTDETGRPGAGAEVRVQSSSVPDTLTVLTGGNGAFSARFPAVSRRMQAFGCRRG